MAIRWYGLVAPEESPTGDRRMFAAQALTFRDFPIYAAWQRVSGSGHQGSVVVASWDRQYAGEGGIWGEGVFLDPAIVPEVVEAIYLLERRLIGPSVDLDPDMTYEVVEHPDRPDEFAMKVTRANTHGVTFVMGPAFPQVHITVDNEDEMAILASAGISMAQFAVNSSTWRRLPLAPRETAFDFDTAITNVAAWSGGDPGKFAQAFLWKDPDGNPTNRETYRLPIADVIDGKLYLIPRAVFSAGTIMSGGHGGLYDTLDSSERTQVQEVITDIYDMLRDEYGDPRVIAPWQRGGRQGATSSDGEPNRTASMAFADEESDPCPDGEHLMPDGSCMCDDEMEYGTTSPRFQSRLGGELEDYWVRGEGAAKIRWGTEGSFDRCVRALREHFPQETEGLCANLHHEATGKWPAEGKRRGEHSLDEGAADPEVVVAASGVLKPEPSWFRDPRLPRATPLHVDDQGRVYGHLATWKQCHMGVGNRCVMAPQSRSNYKWFKTGTVLCSDGSALPIGKITIGTGHADKSYGVVPAVDHYDNTGTCIAVVNAGEDSFGVWVAGALVAGQTEERVAELRRSPLSGDWRRVDGNLELVAALAVNNPGFPVLHEDADGTYSLLAAGVLEDAEGHDLVGEPETLPVVDSRFGVVDEFLTVVDRAERARIVNAAFQDLLPEEEGCGCDVRL